MNTTARNELAAVVNSLPSNDSEIAQKQRKTSSMLGTLLNPLEVRVEKAFQAYRPKPAFTAVCNVFERRLRVQLSSQCGVWSDHLHFNSNVLHEIDAADIPEEQKNQQTFWLGLFYILFFSFGYQRKVHLAGPEEKQNLSLACSQAAIHQMEKLGLAQPSQQPYWEKHGYRFLPLPGYEGAMLIEDQVGLGLADGSIKAESLSQVPLFSEMIVPGQVGAQGDYSAESPQNFASEFLNEWLNELTKTNAFGDGMANSVRLLYFKAKPPRDASEAIMDCLRSHYPIQDDLSLYHNRKLANDYYAPKTADPVEEKTGHIELFLDASGSISAADIGDATQVFTDFFKKRKKKMTYGINVFDTVVHARVEVGEKEDPQEKLKKLAIIGGGGTDFRCITDKVSELEADASYHGDLIVVFTDLCGTFPDRAPTDIVWVTTTSKCHLGNITNQNMQIPGTIIYV